MELGLIYMNARYYVPSLGRFASADTLVPDPTNPQQFNRFSYVLNNPLRFNDPSGHFSEEAIHQYLLDYECGGSPICADDMMWEWSQNSAWWQIIRNAVAGDILLYSDFQSRGSIEARKFEGEGYDKLIGITRTDPNGDPYIPSLPQPLLSDFSAKVMSGRGATRLIGFVRWQDEVPSFYLPSNVSMKQYVQQQWSITAQDTIWAFTGAGVGAMIPAGKMGSVAMAISSSLGFSYVSVPDILRNMTGTQSNHVKVHFTVVDINRYTGRPHRSGSVLWFEQSLSNQGGWRNIPRR
jgi:RHS repeat-associated protein